jgi:inner membrane protein
MRGRAAESISQGWSGRQTILGPVLVVEAECGTRQEERSMSKTRKLAVQLATRLKVAGETHSEIRRRGIHDVPVYRAALRVEAEFQPPALTDQTWSCDQTRLDGAAIVLALADPRGIDRLEPFDIAGHGISWTGGTPLPGEWARGVQARVPIEALYPAAGGATAGAFTLSFDIDLRGSERLAFVPAADATEIALRGDWATPSFDGAFLPAERTARSDGFPDGFRASWKVSGLARPAPALRLDGQAPELVPSAFGVTWFQAADAYLQTERALKYGFLFVALTFLTFFLFELGGGRRAHLVQYGLVGGAICVFYLLLLAISEHARFGLAYFVASVSTATQVTLYGRALLAAPRRIAVLAGVLATLYGCLYLLIGLEEVALLIGAIALFVIVGVTMWMTREV